MAFGDLAQAVVNSGAAAATQSCSLGSTPTLGNLLIFVTVSNGFNATVTSAPSGFTAIEGYQTGASNVFGTQAYYKISAGTETSVAATWGAGNGTAILAEYDFGGNTLGTVTTGEETANVSSVSTSCSSGSATPDQSTNIAIAAWSGDSGVNFINGQAVTGSWTLDQAQISQGSPSGILARLVSNTGSLSTTFSTTDSGDEIYGCIATFSIEAGAGAVPGIEVVRTIPGVAH